MSDKYEFPLLQFPGRGYDNASDKARDNSKLFEYLEDQEKPDLIDATVHLRNADVNGDSRSDLWSFDLDTGEPFQGFGTVGIAPDFFFGQASDGDLFVILLGGSVEYAFFEDVDISEVTAGFIEDAVFTPTNFVPGVGVGIGDFDSNDTLLIKTFLGVFAVGGAELVEVPGPNDYVNFTYARVGEVPYANMSEFLM